MAYFVDASANWNIVNILLESVPELEFGIYALVGLASIWTLYLGSRLAGVRIDDVTPEPESPGRSTK